MGRLGFDGFSERADRLAKSIIRGLWVEDEGRFRQGVHPTHYDNAAALDQSSGADCLLPILTQKAAKCRKYMGRFYLVRGKPRVTHRITLIMVIVVTAVACGWKERLAWHF